MSTPFAKAFSRLRREKNISQRKAAEDLHISQALLSHYENGIREPRIEFIVRACEYYNVSADFLLGRTRVRENPMLLADAVGKNNIKSRRNMRLLLDASAVLIEIIAGTSEVSAENISLYLSAAIYKMLRSMGIADTEELQKKLKLPQAQFGFLCDAAMKVAEASAAEQAETQDAEQWKKWAVSLREQYPSVYAALDDMILQTDSSIAALFKQR